MQRSRVGRRRPVHAGFRFLRTPISASLFLIFSAGAAEAATWTGAALDGAWKNALNWKNSILPGSADTATFTLGGFGTGTVFVGDQSVNLLDVSANYFFTVGSLTLGTGGATVGAGTTTTLDLELRGTNGLTKQGAGTLVLQAAAVYTGATNVAAGKLVLQGSNELIPDASAVTVQSGATLEFSNGDVVETLGSLSGGGTVRFGTTPTTLRIGASNLTTTFDGAFVDASGTGQLIKQGLGDLTLTGDSTLGNSLLVTAGRVLFDTSTSSVGAIDVQNGAELNLAASTLTSHGQIRVRAGATLGVGAGATLAGPGTAGANGTGGTGGVAPLFTSAGTSTIDGHVALQGGHGGQGAQGGAGGAGNFFDVTAGTTSFGGTATIDLLGGDGGTSAGAGATGGAGGAGGKLRFASGTVALGSGAFRLNGGAGGNSTGAGGLGGTGGAAGQLLIPDGSYAFGSTFALSLDGGSGGQGAQGGAGGAAGQFAIGTRTFTFGGGAAMNLRGGAGGLGGTTGGAGAAGGSLELAGGTVQLDKDSVIRLSGGAGGNGSATGGAGGAGGHFVMSSGVLTANGGTIVVGGGAGGTGTTAGQAGAAGSVDITGGTFSFTTGRITTDESLAVTAPRLLQGAGLNVANATVKLGGDFTNEGGAIVLGDGALLDGGRANGPGAAVSTNGVLTLSGAGAGVDLHGAATTRLVNSNGGTLHLLGGATTLSGAGAFLDLSGAIRGGTLDIVDGVNTFAATGGHIDLFGTSHGAGGEGGTLAISGGTNSFGQALAVRMFGASGAANAAGNAGGSLTVSGGVTTFDGGAKLNSHGGVGGGTREGGAGGAVDVTGGTLTFGAGTVLNLEGGAGASGVPSVGGNGGYVSVHGGTLNFQGATLHAAGGAGGLGFQFGLGTTGGVVVDGGVFNFGAGRIAQDDSLVPATPAALVNANFQVHGGTVNLLGDFTNAGGAMTIDAGIVAGGGSRHVTTNGSLVLGGSGTLSLFGNQGAAGNAVVPPFVLKVVAGAGGQGGALDLTGGTLSVLDTATLALGGGSGGVAAGSSQYDATAGAGGRGGNLTLSAGTSSIAGSAVLSVRGGDGGQAVVTSQVTGPFVQHGAFFGGRGGDGGTVALTGGVSTIGGSALVDLSGGTGGYGGNVYGSFGSFSVAGGSGGGGNGGQLRIAGGALTMSGGEVLLAGGAGGSSILTSPGPHGAAGSMLLESGELHLDAGVVTGDAGIPATSATGLYGATLGISGGTFSAPNALTLANANVDVSGGQMNTADVAMNGGTFTISGNATVNVAGTLGVANANVALGGGSLKAQRIDLASGGTFGFTGGTLAVGTFGGNLDQQGGTLSPGNSPGLTTITGHYSVGTNAALHMELAADGLRGVAYDAVDVGGTFTAGGTLDIVLLNGYTPLAGATFDLFDFAAIAGHFDVVTLPANVAFDLSKLYTTGEISVAAVPVPGAIVLLLGALPMLGVRRRFAAA